MECLLGQCSFVARRRITSSSTFTGQRVVSPTFTNVLSSPSPSSIFVGQRREDLFSSLSVDEKWRISNGSGSVAFFSPGRSSSFSSRRSSKSPRKKKSSFVLRRCQSFLFRTLDSFGHARRHSSSSVRSSSERKNLSRTVISPSKWRDRQQKGEDRGEVLLHFRLAREQIIDHLRSIVHRSSSLLFSSPSPSFVFFFVWTLSPSLFFGSSSSFVVGVVGSLLWSLVFLVLSSLCSLFLGSLLDCSFPSSFSSLSSLLSFPSSQSSTSPNLQRSLFSSSLFSLSSMFVFREERWSVALHVWSGWIPLVPSDGRRKSFVVLSSLFAWEERFTFEWTRKKKEEHWKRLRRSVGEEWRNSFSSNMTIGKILFWTTRTFNWSDTRGEKRREERERWRMSLEWIYLFSSSARSSIEFLRWFDARRSPLFRLEEDLRRFSLFISFFFVFVGRWRRKCLLHCSGRECSFLLFLFAVVRSSPSSSSSLSSLVSSSSGSLSSTEGFSLSGHTASLSPFPNVVRRSPFSSPSSGQDFFSHSKQRPLELLLNRLILSLSSVVVKRRRTKQPSSSRERQVIWRMSNLPSWLVESREKALKSEVREKKEREMKDCP